ncbi:unnamed protein product [marine sediment metagenome]|uniref:Uncharacterized protein n=1 Tax=marine sediment metagenome TaxID=412755 RepID=X1U6I7_9ZZZZ
MSNNFVNDAIFGTHKCSTCNGSVGQITFWDDFMEWWNNLDDMIKYGIIAGAGLIAVVVVFSMFKPAVITGVERLEKLLHLKMMRELAED